jgi:(R,R)-butanediol dehydrogenase/meso-butanediol dehydrogenase/diacetyl reductase
MAMTAVRLYAAGDLRVAQIAPPGAPEPGWVRLRITAAGICGSDLHNFRTGQWISRSPSVAGHEFAAEVVELGAGVTGFALGDKVVADSRFWCGTCAACRRGLPQVCETLGFVGEVCDGGFAEETVLPARLLVRHAPDLDPAIAAFAEPLAVALHAVRRLNAPAGAPVLVMGCGPIGGLAALLLSHLHQGAVFVSDRNQARADKVAEVTGARVVTLEDAPRDLRHAVEATGQIAVVQALLDWLDPGGGIALVGIAHGTLALDPNRLVEREISLIGCHAFGAELPEAVALLPALAPQLERFIDRRITLEEVPAAYERLLKGQAQGLKTIILPGVVG